MGRMPFSAPKPLTGKRQQARTRRTALLAFLTHVSRAAGSAVPPPGTTGGFLLFSPADMEESNAGCGRPGVRVCSRRRRVVDAKRRLSSKPLRAYFARVTGRAAILKPAP